MAPTATRRAAIVAAIGGMVAAYAGREGQASTTVEYCQRPEEQAFLALLNDYRAQNGIAPLAPSQTLGAAAQHHALEMAACNCGSHVLQDGTPWYQNIANHGYPIHLYAVGENIAAGYPTAQAVFDAWKASPGHNGAMLDPVYRAVGVAQENPATFNLYWVACFGGGLDTAAVVCGGDPWVPPTATPVPTDVPTAEPTATRTPKPTKTPRGHG